MTTAPPADYRSLRQMLAGESDKRLLIIAISTGNQIANLPPILECARENDCVLWLETSIAREKKWSNGASQVLKSHNVAVLDAVSIPDNPREACQDVEAALRQLSAEWHPVFIGNGGTKPMSGGIGETMRSVAASTSNERYVTVYGEWPKAEMSVFPEGPVGRVFRRRYSAPALTLEDVLLCSGHVLFPVSGKPHVKLWPDAPELPVTEYGSSKEATVRLHRQHQEWGQLEGAAGAGAADYQTATRLLPDRLRNWRAHLDPTEPWRVFNEAKNIATKAARKAATRIAVEAGSPPPDQRVGDAFEDAVAQRVQAWLMGRADPYPIVEAWWGARVAQSTKPDISRVQLDIAFVLASGILVSLECKTFVKTVSTVRGGSTTLEDLNGRLLNLRTTASTLAELVVCWPCYTDFVEEEWFRTMHRRIEENVRPVFRNPIGFTLAGQPREYTVGGASGQCPTFEDALEAALSRYLP